MGVGQRPIGRDQRLGDTAADPHGVQAQAAREVTDKIKAIAYPLRHHKLAGSQQRVNRIGMCHGVFPGQVKSGYKPSAIDCTLSGETWRIAEGGRRQVEGIIPHSQSFSLTAAALWLY
jgi:hypothetical protein